MIDRDRVLAKISTIDRCLARIAEVRGERRNDLLPVNVEDIASLNLQRAIQAAIDIAAHIVSSENYGTPDSTAGVFTLLQQRGIVDADLALRLKRMVGFRNIAVHEYQTVDPAILEALLQRHLGDLKALASQAIEHFGLDESLNQAPSS
ncbi:MAG TPA: DUF86 domain-containing protein [Thermoanaerobaculia bacterium]|nr:DUF86 domain-containing protein [Thermoanaerobaculia bacterium]